MDLEKRTFRYREYFVLIVAALMNCFFLYESIQIFRQVPEADAPGTFPLLLSVVMIVLSALLFVEAYHQIPKATPEEKFPSLASALAASVKEELPINVVAAFLATMIYIGLIALIGFSVSTFLFLVGLTVYLDRKKWKVAILSSAIITVAIYVVFGLIFQVRL